jgi:hypothetical protein
MYIIMGLARPDVKRYMYRMRKKTKRPKTRPYHVLLSETERARLDAAARRERCPASVVLRAFVRSLPLPPEAP